ncbi:uncharacterized protein LOC123658907 [Melitaea cinxia]|uniref:uncharacterized protein LOC123658907 n=1 Tax=Melitaea cinxia TaxID=113334 RepID=UPI001E27411E|nr:uncharacterized protein LOC123658907 [Melitaea cinxia]
MMTRGSKARQAEEQLRLALQELKTYRVQCEQLLRERDENEKELEKIFKKNTELKNQMSQMYTEYTNVKNENENLLKIVNGFDQCRDEYEETLKFNSELKHQLHEANKQVIQLKNINHSLTASQTQCLYNELVENAPNLVSSVSNLKNNISVIDLTSDDSNTTIPMPKGSELNPPGCFIVGWRGDFLL